MRLSLLQLGELFLFAFPSYLMTSVSLKSTADSSGPLNPLSLIQDIFETNEWMTERHADDELLAEVVGRWAPYRFGFLWRDDLLALSFSCVVQLPPIVCTQASLFELVARINECLWIGHFDVSFDEPAFIFRYTLPIRQSVTSTHDQLEDLIEATLVECDRFYPAFRFVALKEKTATEALIASVTDTAGEA